MAFFDEAGGERKQLCSLKERKCLADYIAAEAKSETHLLGADIRLGSQYVSTIATPT